MFNNKNEDKSADTYVNNTVDKVTQAQKEKDECFKAYKELHNKMKEKFNLTDIQWECINTLCQLYLNYNISGAILELEKGSIKPEKVG